MRGGLALVLLALAAACTGAPDGNACALAAPGAPWIAFSSLRTGFSRIWRARADGSCLSAVTRNSPFPREHADRTPTWHGAVVLFASDRDGTLHLWRHDVLGSGDAPVGTGDLASAAAPAFSPDGARVAFEGRAAGATTTAVYVVPAEGGTPVALTSGADDGAPAWAPDGGTVYFVSTRGGARDVWAVPATGGAAVQVTSGSRIVGRPAVAAGALLYARTVAGGAATELVRHALAGGAVAVLSSRDDADPALSSDGTRLALRSTRAGDGANVFVAAPDGTGAWPVTSDGASDGEPTFAAGLPGGVR